MVGGEGPLIPLIPLIWLIGGRWLIRTLIRRIKGRWGHQDSDLAHKGSSELRVRSMGGHLEVPSQTVRRYFSMGSIYFDAFR